MKALQFSLGGFSLKGGGKQLERERLGGGERRKGRSPGSLPTEQEERGKQLCSKNRSSSSETIPGNLLFLLPPPPLFFFSLKRQCRQDVVINNQKGRKAAGRSYWEAQIKAGSFPGRDGGLGLMPGPGEGAGGLF